MTVQLGKHSFTLNNTLEDKVRRETYFKNGQGSLTQQEQAILDSIGITKPVESTLKLYLAEFFEKLPLCQTDTSLVLSKECEVPHYVVWSSLFGSHTAAKDGLLQNRKQFKPQMDIEDAMDVALIAGMKSKVDPDADFKRLFTLFVDGVPVASKAEKAVKAANAPVATPEPDLYLRLFTLLLR